MSSTIEDLRESAPGSSASPETQGTLNTTTLPDETEAPPQIMRHAIAVGSMMFGTAFLIGGMFTGLAARFFAVFGAIAGIALASFAIKAEKRPMMSQIGAVVGVFFAGVLAMLTVGPDGVGKLPDFVGSALENARGHRPPTKFDPGWRALIVWAMGGLGFASAWIAIAMRRAAAAILLPIPVLVFASTAQAPEMQVIGGLVALVGFIGALAVLFRPDQGGERMPLAFEMRRAAKTAPMLHALIVALVALSRTNLLFPPPIYDPTQQAILPKATPLSEVVDRVLFTVKADGFRGPWRTGVLDVYDGEAWRLPPFSGSEFKEVPGDGVLSDLSPGGTARFTLEGLEGTVLPTPTRPTAIVGERLPQLLTDDRSGTIRVETGQVEKGIVYGMAFAVLPSEQQVLAAPPPPANMQVFLDAPPAPTAVRNMLRGTESQHPWARLSKIRTFLLDTVVATGGGLPKEVPPSKVQDLLAGSKEGTPFEIVAAQALISRWAGVPSRIGYGFDGGEETDAETYEYRPKHGSLWLEVWFQDHGWLPVVGIPRQAKQSLNSDEPQIEANLVPSDDIAIELFLPLKPEPANPLFKTIQRILLILIPSVLLIGLAYMLAPLVIKSRRRAKLRRWAFREGPVARIAVAYAEFRDTATDLGAGDPYATPLAFLKKLVPDPEHTELAWLVTRALWGDLRENLSMTDVHAAEELSRSLRRRIFEIQPFTIRGISMLSRLSLKHPYAPELSPVVRKRVIRPLSRKKERAHASA